MRKQWIETVVIECVFSNPPTVSNLLYKLNKSWIFLNQGWPRGTSSGVSSDRPVATIKTKGADSGFDLNRNAFQRAR